MLDDIGGMATGWLIAALALGIAELLVPGVFLIFLAVAAAITAALLVAVPGVALPVQLLSFAVWSAVAVAVGRRWYRDFPVTGGDARLNDRTARMIGSVARLETAIEHGRGRVTIDDGSWPARGPELPAGSAVRIVAVDGGVVVVEVAED